VSGAGTSPQRGLAFPRFVGTVDVGALEMQITEQIAAMQANIQMLFEEGVLNRGQAKSLSVKLDQIQQRLDAGQTHVALNQLNAFTKLRTCPSNVPNAVPSST
jgi:hypothetical protein